MSMKTTIKHGAEIETLTPAEATALVQAEFERRRTTRIRASAVVGLDATGGGQDEVYTVPVGFEFEARRVFLDLDTAASPNDGNVALNVAGKAIEYLRSGTRMEYGLPLSTGATPQVPGSQTWGAEQGPYLRNGEVFEVKARGLTANARLTVAIDGILRRSVVPPVR